MKRLEVYKYRKSGKLVALVPLYQQYMVLEFDEDLTTIKSVNNRLHVNSSAIEPTPYTVEVAETIRSNADGTDEHSYSLIRVISASDMDLEQWKNTESLDDLPVSPDAALTPEEKAWAGQRDGNLGGGFALTGVALIALLFAVNGYRSGSGYVLPSLVLLACVYLLAKYRWRKAVSASPDRLAELDAHKKSLRTRSRLEQEHRRTEFEKALADFGTWQALKPQHFEVAVATLLNKQGFNVQTTSYSSDGGVDIFGTDDRGAPVIVQAKQYAKNVGVSVIREMIGVRQGYDAQPRTIVVSLVGFSREARKLAADAEIELRNVRSELLKL